MPRLPLGGVGAGWHNTCCRDGSWGPLRGAEKQEGIQGIRTYTLHTPSSPKDQNTFVSHFLRNHLHLNVPVNVPNKSVAQALLKPKGTADQGKAFRNANSVQSKQGRLLGSSQLTHL